MNAILVLSVGLIFGSIISLSSRISEIFNNLLSNREFVKKDGVSV